MHNPPQRSRIGFFWHGKRIVCHLFLTHGLRIYILRFVHAGGIIFEGMRSILSLVRKKCNRFRNWYHWERYFHLINRKVKALRCKKKIRVLFIAFNVSNWKYDSLFRAMQANSRFSPTVLIVPEMQIRDLSQRAEKMKMLREYCHRSHYPFFSLCNADGDTKDRSISSEYDILVYTKPYLGSVPASLDYPLYKDRLMLAIHYACHSVDADWACNQPYQLWAWMDFYENETTARGSAQIKKCGMRNNVVTGLPVFDSFMLPPRSNPWKSQPNHVRKIIWAPHWTIPTSDSWLGRYSNFLSMAEAMRDLAVVTRGTFQWAFKPHPLLRHNLYSHPDWGKNRTDEYWRWWLEQSNTQLEDGEYSDLFLTSDALIHDCCSFSCEYHFTEKPVLFICDNEEKHIDNLNEMAVAGFMAQYIGKGMVDVKQFLKEVVLRGVDPKLDERMKFRNHYLIPPNGRTAADNIIRAILYR